jgi:hypothetical protein
MITFSRCLTVALIALVVAGGCSQKPSIKTVPVSGKVTLDGQPLSGVNVTFVPATGESSGLTKPSATGVTGADGSYKLVTMASGSNIVNGAPPGSYKVMITKQVAQSAAPGAPMAAQGLSPEEFTKQTQNMSADEAGKMAGSAAQPGEGSTTVKSEIPERYTKADDSGLTATVADSGAQTVDFPLTSQ